MAAHEGGGGFGVALRGDVREFEAPGVKGELLQGDVPARADARGHRGNFPGIGAV